jgi:hypothetical protein
VGLVDKALGEFGKRYEDHLNLVNSLSGIPPKQQIRWTLREAMLGRVLETF